MKLKISYQSQKRLWIKKIISKGLVMGILFNNVGYSFANTEILDGRYETFEGNNITIDNVLEEDKVDVEIEGNTLVNLTHGRFEKAGGATITASQMTENAMNATIINQGSLVGIKKAVLKDNTTYTVVCDLNTNLNGIKYSFKNSSNYLQGGSGYDYTDYTNGYTRVVKKITTTKDCTHVVIGFHEIEEVGKYLNIKNLILLEGDWTNKEIPNKYFEGIKSVGQDDENGHNIEVFSENKNLFLDDVINQTGTGNSANGWIYPTMFSNSNTRCRSSKFIKVKPNTDYFFSSNNKFHFAIAEFDMNERQILENHWTIPPEGGVHRTSNKCENIIVVIRKPDNSILNPEEVYGNVQIEENTSKTSYVSRIVNKKEIILSEPLRSLPNGIKDRVIKRNGQWVIERNCAEIVLDGSEIWHSFPEEDSNGVVRWWSTPKLSAKPGQEAIANNVYTISTLKEKYNFVCVDWNGNLLYGISKDVLPTQDSNSFKQLLSQNPTTLVYQLATPIYEVLEVEPTLNIYLEITYISNNSAIPCGMKITIDRIINRAIEAIQIAKESPTIENITNARYWTNLLKESIKKDELNGEINDITNVEDLTIEKKTTTANVDLYIKPQNSLSMTLSTNAIIFDEFDSTEDMEKLKVVDITVNSSLPYRLNSYLVSEIKNNDGSNIIPKEQFNIRLNGETDYKAFNNINEKLVLKDDCSAGVDNVHSIDLILKSGKMNEADVYKTTIKFEAEQK